MLLTGILANPTTAGLFGAQFKIVLALGTAGYLAAISMYPILASLKEKPAEFMKTATNFAKWMFFASVPIAIIGTVWTDKILRITLGTQYVDSLVTFRIMIWTIPLSYVTYSFEFSVLAKGKERYRVIANLFSIITMVVFSLLLIQKYFEIGAALAYFFSIALFLILMYLGLYGIRFPSRHYKSYR